MGTIADKLNYLNNTKSKLKNEINKIGGNINNSTTFRNYVSNIKSIYDKLPKVEGSGSDITLNDTEEALLSLTPEGYASQDGDPTSDTPIPIKVVTGEQNVEIHGKNLFDKDNATILNAYFDTNKNVITGNIGNRTTFIKCKKNKTYTVSALDNAMYNITLGLSSVLPAIGTSVYNNCDYIGATSASITTDNNAEYLVLRYKERKGTGISLDAIKDYILIEEGTQATEYEPYYTPQTYPLSLGNIELAKIENYKDYIFKNVTDSPYYNANLDLNDWYLHKEIIGENLWEKAWVYENESSTPVPRTVLRLRNMSTIHVYFSNCFLSSEMNNQQIVNRLKTDSPNWFLASANNLTGIETTDSKNIKLNKITTFLQSISANIYYRLITPTNTKITDTTLIQQLENMNNNARSYKGTTIIECTSASEENDTLQVKTVALKDLDLLTEEETLSTNNVSEIQPINEVSLNSIEEIESEESE